MAITADERLLLDPCKEECESACAVMTFVVDQDGGIITSQTIGCCSEESFFEGVQAAVAAGKTVSTFMRIAIEKRVAAERACWAAQ